MAQGSNAKDMRDLMDRVNDTPGWRVSFTSKAGWKVYPPEGRPISVSHGPRNPWRHRKNTIAKLRRAGLDL